MAVLLAVVALCIGYTAQRVAHAQKLQSAIDADDMTRTSTPRRFNSTQHVAQARAELTTVRYRLSVSWKG